MRRFKNFKVTTVLIAGLLAPGVLAKPSFANSANNNVRRGLPGRRISGGSRSPSTACLLPSPDKFKGQSVVALVPENNVSRTSLSHPTFWFALPAISADRHIEFALMDEAEELVYAKTLQPNEKAGLLGISMPEESPALAADQTYRWYLSVVCDPGSRATDLVVWGWLERAASTPDGSPLGRAHVEFEPAAWNDALTAVADLYSDLISTNQSTADLDKKWTDLLASEDLSWLLEAPSTAGLTNILTNIESIASEPIGQSIENAQHGLTFSSNLFEINPTSK